MTDTAKPPAAYYIVAVVDTTTHSAAAVEHNVAAADGAARLAHYAQLGQPAFLVDQPNVHAQPAARVCPACGALVEAARYPRRGTPPSAET
jgi:hypothetical protein